MGRRAGIPLIDLFGLVDRVTAALPQSVEDFLNRFAVTEHATRHAPGSVFHHGVLQPLDDVFEEIPTGFDIGIGELRLPLVQTGIPFQLAFARGAVTGNLEPLASAWRLDLSIDAFNLILEGLEPAIFVPDTSTVPRHLLRDPKRDKVRITGTGVLRIANPGTGVVVGLVDQPDPLDPAAASGAVTSIVCSPPHFFIGGSEFGLSVGRLQFDFSESYSPPDAITRGQGPGWVGVAIKEATLYAPRNLPGLGDFSGGVRNVLIGSPAGLQGELEVQFGRTPLDPASFAFKQVTPTGTLSLVATPAGNAYTVPIEGSQDADVVMRVALAAAAPPDDGSLPPIDFEDWTVRWVWPDGSEDEGDASSGSVRHGQVLRATPIEIVTVDGVDTEFPHPEITIRFIAAGEGPAIQATIGTQRFSNTVHLGGTAAALGTVTLAGISTAPSGDFEWQIEGRPERQIGLTFALDVGDLVGEQTVLLRELVAPDDIRTTRLRLTILAEGDLLVGCEAGVFAASNDDAALALAAVEDTFDLSDFHASGDLNAKLEEASLDPADPTRVTVPTDGLARVTLPGDTVVIEYDRHVQILMDFDTDNELRWGTLSPAGAPGSGAFSQSDLLAWAARYPGAKFVVVGRCDDIGDAGYNAALAADRADRAKALLTERQPGQTGEVVAAASVFIRGEQSDFDAANNEGDDLEEDAELALDPAEKSDIVATGAPADGWLIRSFEDTTGWPANRDATHPAELVRETYRRVDIYAVGGTPGLEAARKTDTPTVGAALRRSFVPAPGRAPAAVTGRTPRIDYRVKLRVAWDSPTVAKLKDAIPTLAEAEFSWTPGRDPLPDVDGVPVVVNKEVLTVFATWSHDTRTGYTKASLGVRSDGDPNGLIFSDNPTLTAALAFGPALLSGVSDDDLVGSAARFAALFAAAGFATASLGPGGPLIAAGSKVALMSAAYETEMRSISDPGPDMQVRLVTDYVCTLHVNAGVLGLKTAPPDPATGDPGQPMMIRYKRVGVEYDSSAEGWDRFGLVYDTSSLEIEDPGRWLVTGDLGELLRIVEFTVGVGSVWFEARIAVAIDLGLIEVTEAIIRLTFEDGSVLPKFELRGLAVRASVPGVLEGEGSARIDDDGTFRAGIQATVIPAGLGAQAAIAFAKFTEPPDDAPSIFLSVFLGVQFATPLPLAQSGLAIYGFKGQFTMNGARTVEGADPIGRELAWWSKDPQDQFSPKKGQYALGVGAVVGTLPDVSFSVSCGGMIVVAFPDPEVILGVDVKIVQVPDIIAKDERGTEAAITGLIVIDSTAIKLAASGTYTIPKVLTVNVPFAGYFPFPPTQNGVYVRIGSDGVAGRYGEPATLTLLPDVIDARAWAYLMIEQDGLPQLGGDNRFSFDGFSVGFGAGWDIRWSADPIVLRASAKVLVGFGTAPLMIKGGVFVDGELDMVVVSISATGELVLEAREQGGDVDVRIEGEFCGEVDLWFFSLEGCVGISIAPGVDTTPPQPPSPVKGVSLTDRRDRVMGVATRATSPASAAVFDPTNPDGGAAVDANNTVWPDTAPVIHFSHYVENGMPAIAQFAPGPTPTQPKWFGSSELKYAYRLVSLQLLSAGSPVTSADPTARLQSVWTAGPYRQPDASGVDNPLPSEHEGPNLKLLDWDPWSWVVNMEDGGESQAGDPADTIGDICDPLPFPHTACLFGRSARRAGLHAIRLRQEVPGPPPYPSRFLATGEPVVRLGATHVTGRDLQTLAQGLGAQIVPGDVVGLPIEVAIGSTELTSGYRLPGARWILGDGFIDLAIGWEARFDRRVTSPVVTLLVCDAPAQSEVGDRPADMACDSFVGVKANGQAIAEIARPDLTLRAIEPTAPMKPVDHVDLDATPVALGSDGIADIAFAASGIEIKLARPSRRVELYVMLEEATRVDATALAADDTALDSDRSGTTTGVAHVLVLEGEAITRIRLTGGGGDALLFKICWQVDKAQEQPRKCETFARLKPSDRPVARLTHGAFKFEVIERRARLVLADDVEQSRPLPRPGTDRAAEIRFPASGVRITLAEPCPVVEVHVMLFSGQAVKGEAFDAGGASLAKAVSGTEQRVPMVLTFASVSGKPIVTIVLTGGSSEAVIYRICCLARAGDATCVTFDGLKTIRDPFPQLEHRGLRFTSLDRGPRLTLVDLVDAASLPDRVGRDKVPELGFEASGVRVELREPCAAVEIKVMLLAGIPVKAVALNRLGTRIARAETSASERVPQTIRLEAEGIVAVELTEGGGKAVVYEICCSAGEAQKPRAPAGSAGSLGESAVREDALAVVTGIVGEALRDDWAGQVLETKEGKGDRACTLVSFAPRDLGAGPWDGFRIATPPGKVVTLVSICGIDQGALDARANDAVVRSTTRDSLIDVVLAEPDARRAIALLPGRTYEIVVGWQWQAWQPTSPGQSPPDPDPDAWSATLLDTLRFATAPLPGATSTQQDGLNEHVFDPRDVDRYLIGIEPADGREVHFTGDSIWLHFDCGHVEQLVEVYGRRLEIEIRRTDPPPPHVPEATSPLAVAVSWNEMPREFATTGDRRLNDALVTAPCITDGGTPFGGASLSVTADLAPLAHYDLTVVVPKADGSDRAIVRATRFRTSRHAGPRDFIDALGYRDGAGSPYLPDDYLVPDGSAALPVDALIESDVALDVALAGIGAETLPLPTRRARSYALWRFSVSNGWTIEGLLVDSLEPMIRERTLVAASGLPQFGTRLALTEARVDSTTVLALRRVNARWTRALLTPSAPLKLGPASGDHALSLHFTLTSGTMSGARRLRAVPSILEREGL